MNINLSGKHAFVTGASQGIGEAIARELHAQGARVTLVARTQAKLDSIAGELGERAFGVVADVMKAQEITDALGAAQRRFGPVDIAVNNAGGIITSDGNIFRPFDKVPDGDWLGTFDLNVLSAGPSMPYSYASRFPRRLGNQCSYQARTTGDDLCNAAVGQPRFPVRRREHGEP